MCIIKIPVDCKTAKSKKTQGQVEIEEKANYTLRESNTIVIMLDVKPSQNEQRNTFSKCTFELL